MLSCFFSNALAECSRRCRCRRPHTTFIISCLLLLLCLVVCASVTDDTLHAIRASLGRDACVVFGWQNLCIDIVTFADSLNCPGTLKLQSLSVPL